ncbi:MULTISPECIES: protein kinase domain-containing protein [Kitasatospora]|uniref:protein kinase domain-containing protein n=1 Tax=Kitasatospora TaxID=2063 RepID=UPI000C7119B7|nr:protein kinase [Kitasatospora sp. GP30]
MPTMGTLGDGRYRLTHRLGRGGMAEVLAAQDIRLGRTVAVKLLRAELAQDEVARLRFTREAHSVASLNHHSIVAVYDTGEELVDGESTPYIVMELVEGRTVRELLVAEEAPPVDQALIIIAGVLEALDYSHRHGIVHRDIKPANVIITTTGAVKVMDFGIARALAGEATTMTQTGMVMGTPQYLSPEQALGKQVDHRSDLYAAGCMLYELLALRPPFTGDTPLSVVYQHVQDAPVPPSQTNSRVPWQLDELVLRSLAKNPDDRFQSAGEFRAHLQHALREMHAASGGYPTTVMGAGTPADGTAVTQLLGGVGDRTTMLPYGSAAGGYQTGPYQGGGGPGGGGQGGGYGGGGEDDGYGDARPGGNRRRLLAIAAGVVLVLAAAIGIVAASQSGGPSGGTTGGTSSVSPSASPSDSQSPSDEPTSDSPSLAPTTSAPTRGHTPSTPATGGDGYTNQPTSRSSHPSQSASTPTDTASASDSSSPTGGATSSPTGGSPSSPSSGGGTSAPPSIPVSPPHTVTPPTGQSSPQ